MLIHVAYLWMCVLFCFSESSVCLHVCAYASKLKVHCGSAFEPGPSGLPYYCTPPVCVPDVFGALVRCGGRTTKKNLESNGFIPSPVRVQNQYIKL